MMLLQKSYSDHPGYFAAALQQQHYAHCHQTASLSQLSKEQLIERVVQLEMEKSSRSSNNMKLPPPACAMATTTRTVSSKVTPIYSVYCITHSFYSRCSTLCQQSILYCDCKANCH